MELVPGREQEHARGRERAHAHQHGRRLDEEAQDACVDAGIIQLKGAAAASVALTVRDIGSAPPVPRKKARAAPPAEKGKLSAVVRAKRGVTYYK